MLHAMTPGFKKRLNVRYKQKHIFYKPQKECKN